MVIKTHMDGCFPCQNGTAKNVQTRWRRKRTGTPPSEPAVPPPGTPSAPPGDSEETESYEIEGMPSSCVNIHSPLPNTQLFNHHAYVKDSEHNKDFNPDLRSTLSAGWQCR